MKSGGGSGVNSPDVNRMVVNTADLINECVKGLKSAG